MPGLPAQRTSRGCSRHLRRRPSRWCFPPAPPLLPHPPQLHPRLRPPLGLPVDRPVDRPGDRSVGPLACPQRHPLLRHWLPPLLPRRLPCQGDRHMHQLNHFKGKHASDTGGLDVLTVMCSSRSSSFAKQEAECVHSQPAERRPSGPIMNLEPHGVCRSAYYTHDVKAIGVEHT